MRPNSLHSGFNANLRAHAEISGTKAVLEIPHTFFDHDTPLTLITGTFFRFVARRLDTRPEDYEDAEISDGAGELGFYSPHSWWPIVIALSASVTAVGIALWLPWLIVAGVVFVLSSAAGLVFEYYTGAEKH